MGMKQRRCDGPCRKKRRFDADKWVQEGWTEQPGGTPERPIRWCPQCSAQLPEGADEHQEREP